MALSAPLFKEKRVIKVKLEATKGGVEVADSAIGVFDLDIKQTRNFERRNGSGLYRQPTHVGTHGADSGECSFKFLLRSSGGAFIDPAQLIVLQGCGLAGGLQVQSAHSADETITIIVWEDGKKKTLYGAMGEVEFGGEVGVDMIVTCNFMGKYADDTEALPAYAPSRQTPMKIKSGTFTLGGENILIANYLLKMNNNVVLRPDASDSTGILSAAIGTTEPTITCDCEDDLIAGYDFDGILKIGTTAAIVLQVSDGTNTVTFTAAAVQTTELTPGERDGIATLDFTGMCISAAASDNAVVIAAG